MGLINYENYSGNYGNPIHAVKKKFWINNEWVEVKRYKMVGSNKIEEWLKKHYPESNGKWLKTFDNIVMDEAIYLHWMLCQ